MPQSGPEHIICYINIKLLLSPFSLTNAHMLYPCTGCCRIVNHRELIIIIFCCFARPKFYAQFFFFSLLNVVDGGMPSIHPQPHTHTQQRRARAVVCGRCVTPKRFHHAGNSFPKMSEIATSNLEAVSGLLHTYILLLVCWCVRSTHTVCCRRIRFRLCVSVVFQLQLPWKFSYIYD